MTQLDDHISLKESFRWQPPIEVYTGDRAAPDGAPPGGRWYRGKAITVTRTGNLVKYTEPELTLAGRSLRFRPVSIDHVTESKYGRWLPFPQNQLVDAEYEDGAVEYLAYVTDPGFHEMYDKGMIDHTSIEGSGRGPAIPPGFPKTPYGVAFTGMTFVTKNANPGDPDTTVERLKETVQECLLSEISRNVHLIAETEKGIVSKAFDSLHDAINGVAEFKAIVADAPVYYLLEDGSRIEWNKLGEPFAGYANFSDCVTQNQGKSDPEGYCAVVMRKIEGATVMRKVDRGGENKMVEIEEMIEDEVLNLMDGLEETTLFDMPNLEEAKKWVQAWRKKAQRKGTIGSLHKALGVPLGQKIPLSKIQKAVAAGGKLGQKARFALSARKFHHTMETFTPEELYTTLAESLAEPKAELDQIVKSEGVFGAVPQPTAYVDAGIITGNNPLGPKETTLEERVAYLQKRGMVNDDKIRADLKRIRETLITADNEVKEEVRKLREEFTRLPASFVAKVDLAELEAKIDAKFGTGLGETKTALLEIIASLKQAVNEKQDQVENLKETIDKALQSQKDLVALTQENEARRKEQAEALTEVTANLTNLRETLRTRSGLKSIPFRGSPPDSKLQETATNTEGKPQEVEDWQLKAFREKARR